MEFKPTKEQLDFFNEVKNGFGNILIQAYAGCSKTTSAIESLKFIPEDKSKIFLAFNKHIKDELKLKLPEGVKTNTLHSIGYGGIIRKYKDVQFDEFKIDKIINKKKGKWNVDQEFNFDTEKVNEYLKAIKKLVDLCRLTLTTKKQYVPYLCDRYNIKYNSNTDIKRVFMVLEEAFNDKHTIDYTDMVFMPAVDNKIFLIQYDYVYVDEIQDLNKAQQVMVDKMVKRDRKTGQKTGRMVLIGDFFQSIYGFTGISEKTFDWYHSIPNTKKLTLSTTFRCAKNIVEHAQKYAPQLKAMDNAVDGIVREGDVIKEAENGDFVLCRTTMPLVKLFFHFLLKEKKAIIRGGEIGLSLIDMTKDVENIEDLKQVWQEKLDTYKLSLLAKGVINPEEDSAYTSLEDKVLTLLFIARLSKNIEDLKLKIQSIFSDEIEGIILSTVHKAKGLEADRVFIVRPDLLPMTKNIRSQWEKQQENNLTYVAITRARKELVYDNKWTDED